MRLSRGVHVGRRGMLTRARTAEVAKGRAIPPTSNRTGCPRYCPGAAVMAATQALPTIAGAVLALRRSGWRRALSEEKTFAHLCTI